MSLIAELLLSAFVIAVLNKGQSDYGDRMRFAAHQRLQFRLRLGMCSRDVTHGNWPPERRAIAAARDFPDSIAIGIREFRSFPHGRPAQWQKPHPAAWRA